MEAPSRQFPQRQFSTADELLHVLVSEAHTGDPLATVAALDQLSAQITALRMQVLANAAALEDPDHKIVSVADQLHATNRLTRKAAKADVRLAQALDQQFQVIAQAWQAGALSEAQARAIVNGLRHLPAGLSSEQLSSCQHQLVGYAKTFDPDELRQLALRMVEVIDPEYADQLMADRLAREARLAFDRRYLTLTPDHHGSMLIRGQLPIADGELLRTQLDALTPSAASYGLSEETPSGPARRADALIRLSQRHAASGNLPASGGDRPQVLVTMALEALQEGLGQATLLNNGEQLSAAEARRLACDANLIPAVLGSDSRLLDLGRSVRLFTAPVRLALALRDRGCAFPGCDAPPGACDAHHITPWHSGGETSRDNGVLLCPYHHRMVEPDPRRSPEYQWEVIFDEHGLPRFVPPLQVDLQCRPRQHNRYKLRHPDPLPEVEPDDPGEPPPERAQHPNWAA